MSKSFYQFKFDPSCKQAIQSAIDGIIMSDKFKKCLKPGLFLWGNGWITAKRKLEYVLTDDTLNICVWKVVAPILPCIEMGCSDANGAYGMALNESLKTAVTNIALRLGSYAELHPEQMGITVGDNHLALISTLK